MALQIKETEVLILDGKGNAKSVDLSNLDNQVSRSKSEFVLVWRFCSDDNTDAKNFLSGLSLDNFVCDALTAEETRPRCTVHGDGVILNLRGVNLNEGAEPEDMISVRLWIEHKRIVGVWKRPLKAVQDLFDSMDRKKAPESPGDMVARLALRLADRAEPTISNLNETIDGLEEDLLNDKTKDARTVLAQVRRQAITLRRYMFPQRDALSTLEIEDVKWLTERDRCRIREAADRVTRMAEELDTIRDRAQIVNDQIMDKRAEVMNNQMLLLSIVAAIFLPLGLLTGLLGVNVGGIPGADHPWGFWIVCGLLIICSIFQILLFRWMGILKK